MKEESKDLFIALLEDDDDKIEEKLLSYIYGMEYNWATDGGEPDLDDILAIKLIEKIKGHKYYASMIYQDRYLEHVGIKVNEKEKEERKG